MDKLDSLDQKILQRLSHDARQSSEALAKDLNVSPSTVRRRINRLIENDVLRIAGIVNPAKAGYTLMAVIGIDAAHDRLDAVVSQLAGRPEVRWIATTTGRFDIVTLASFRSTEDLGKFLQQELPKMDGVRNSETFVCLRVEKGSELQL